MKKNLQEVHKKAHIDTRQKLLKSVKNMELVVLNFEKNNFRVTTPPEWLRQKKWLANLIHS